MWRIRQVVHSVHSIGFIHIKWNDFVNEKYCNWEDVRPTTIQQWESDQIASFRGYSFSIFLYSILMWFSLNQLSQSYSVFLVVKECKKKKKICRFFGIQKYNPDVSNFDSRIYLRAIIDNRFISLKEFADFVLFLFWFWFDALEQD